MFVKGSGHFILDDRFNLTKAIIEAPFDPFKLKTEKNYDPIIDWKLPTDHELREAIENRVKPLRILTSPKFFSTGVDGKRVAGLGKIPNNDDRPLLFVANHQLLGLDLGLIIAELLEQREIAARGLAHPIIFQGANGFGGGPGPAGTSRRITKRNRDGLVDPPLGDFQTFGAVMVTPRNYYRLMETGQTALLFPGGVREVFHGKDEAYELFWPEKVDFVRVAAKFNATIVPISAVGAADSVNILVDAPDILNLPFGLGERALNNTQNVIAARYDQENTDELFQPPLVVPKLTPARHYFIFGKPFDASNVVHTDKEACAKLYNDVKAELRRGLDDLLVARKKDPFSSFYQRLAIEQLLKKQMPTFPVEELNK
jgi:1-acyl-sn-glycerol-3-phosphate acyltransferase